MLSSLSIPTSIPSKGGVLTLFWTFPCKSRSSDMLGLFHACWAGMGKAIVRAADTTQFNDERAPDTLVGDEAWSIKLAHNFSTLGTSDEVGVAHHIYSSCCNRTGGRVGSQNL
eukprot:3343520-Rhodomonas_salina.4